MTYLFAVMVTTTEWSPARLAAGEISTSASTTRSKIRASIGRYLFPAVTPQLGSHLAWRTGPRVTCESARMATIPCTSTGTGTGVWGC